MTRFALFAVCLSSVGIAACKDPPSSGAADASATSTGDATSSRVAKKIDLDKCDAGVQELERIAKSASKACTSSAQCTEWIRNGNCGSIPVARPFPPGDSAARWQEMQGTVDVACPDAPKCKWASLGVECRAGTCVPSLEGHFDTFANDAGF